MLLPSWVDHLSAPAGVRAVANPASEPVMMLPSLLRDGDVLAPPWLVVLQRSVPFIRKDATPMEEPTTKPVPFARIAGVEFVETPAAPPL